MLKKLLHPDAPYKVRQKVGKLMRRHAGGVFFQYESYLWNKIKQGNDCKQFILDLKDGWEEKDASERRECIQNLSSSDERELLLKAADSFIAHEFDLLGSGPVQLGEPINWHKDFISGYEWCAAQHFSQFDWVSLPDGVDIKVPWELSRCNHFSALGLADWLTDDPKYYQSFKKDLISWLEANSFECGVNWSCPMDIALRAVNWVNALQLFIHRVKEEDDHVFVERVVESLWLHGRHIMRNLEWTGSKTRKGGNHLVANLIGLLAIGTFFISTQQGMAWHHFAKEELEEQIVRQTNEDGTNHESSTSYHRLTLEMFLWADSLMLWRGKRFSDRYAKTISQMIGFVESYSDQSGYSPQMGDNDSGRVLTASIGRDGDHGYLKGQPDGRAALLNRFLLRRDLEWPEAVRSQNGDFPVGGYYFAQVDRNLLGVRAGKLSPSGGHSHCDQLSFIWHLDSSPVLVDRGTGSYTGNRLLRNQLRGTQSHNAPLVNDWEQNEFSKDPSRVFGMRDGTQTQVTRWDVSESSIGFSGVHRGYHRYRSDVEVVRELDLSDSQLCVRDQITSLVEGDFLVWNFHFAPGVVARLGDKGSCHISTAKHEIVFKSDLDYQVEIIQYPHSGRYGESVDALCMRVTHCPSHGGCKQDHEFVFEYSERT